MTRTARYTLSLAVIATMTVHLDGATAQRSPRERADLVLQLIPPAARPDATILFRDADGDEVRGRVVYREGNGPFICVSDASNSRTLSMVCHHRVLEERLQLERALSRETGLRGEAFTTRLCEEVASRHLDVPNGAMEITASLMRQPDGLLAREMTIYHLLWLPFATDASAGVPAEDPGEGHPWLHQAGTCGAHVMWSDVIELPRRP
jgi:hypothetical protein